MATPGYRTLLKSGNVRLLLLAYSLNTFALSYLLSYYLNITLTSIGGPALVGLFVMVSNVFAGFLPIVAGALADSHGRRRVILVSTVFEVLALLSLALVADSGGGLLVLPAIVLSASFIAPSPALFSLIAESVPIDCMGEAMSLPFMASSASGILSYFIFGSLVWRLDNPRLFALSAPFVAVSLFLYFRVSETAARKTDGAFERFGEALKGITLLREPS